MICVAEVLEHLALGAREGPVAVLGLAVAALARVAGDGQDGDVGLLLHLVDEGAGDLHFSDDGVAEQHRGGRCGIVHRLGLLQGDVLLVPVLDIGIDLQAVDPEAVGDVADIGLVDVAGARAAGDEVIGADAVQGHLLHALERQDAVVLEQDEAFGSGLADKIGVTREVRLVGILIPGEAGGADDVLEHPADVAVHVGLGDGAVLDPGDDTMDLILHSGLHQVVAGDDRLGGTGFVAPVGHHDAVEAPLVAEDGGQEVMALLGVGAVEFVVRGHDGPGVGLLHHYLEALQGHLAQGAGVDAGVILHAVGLLVVGGEML